MANELHRNVLAKVANFDHLLSVPSTQWLNDGGLINPNLQVIVALKGGDLMNLIARFARPLKED